MPRLKNRLSASAQNLLCSFNEAPATALKDIADVLSCKEYSRLVLSQPQETLDIMVSTLSSLLWSATASRRDVFSKSISKSFDSCFAPDRLGRLTWVGEYEYNDDGGTYWSIETVSLVFVDSSGDEYTLTTSGMDSYDLDALPNAVLSRLLKKDISPSNRDAVLGETDADDLMPVQVDTLRDFIYTIRHPYDGDGEHVFFNKRRRRAMPVVVGGPGVVMAASTEEGGNHE